jgi:hypothetical protein
VLFWAPKEEDELKYILALLTAAVFLSAAKASDVSVLPSTFKAQQDVTVCPSEDDAIELLAALLVEDYAVVSESVCSVMSHREVVIHELEVHVNLEVEDPGCVPSCIDVFVVGIYRTIAYGKYIVHAIGPELLSRDLGMKEGIVAGIEYDQVLVAPKSYAYFLENPPEGMKYL